MKDPYGGDRGAVPSAQSATSTFYPMEAARGVLSAIVLR